ncbi:MAG: VWA domain-containing protein [Clostridiales Family XIII bacterium]|jgi:uncharacterized protein YegL|nr:VWA domain-containing protein [Clostridiales Family XIII bacterium]
MKTPLKTELVFILDRSGSMAGLESDTIGGYNAMMDKQREAGGDITVTTVLFDDHCELLHDRIKMGDLRRMDGEEYFVRGSTALIDAIGKTIKKIENARAHMQAESRADKVIFVITTDGYENASRQYRAEDVRAMVEQKKDAEGWEFIFLGANIDAVETARSFGFEASRSHNYMHDGQGVGMAYDATADAISLMQCSDFVPPEALGAVFFRLDADYESRSGGDAGGGEDEDAFPL